MLTQDPKITIRQLLTTGWNSANVSNVTPKVHTGWFRDDWMDEAQVCITGPFENPLSGGATGFYGFRGDGSPGGVRLTIGDMVVSVWAHYELPYAINPKQLTFEMSEEVKRIIDANTITISDFEWLTWLSKSEIVDNSLTPTLFRYNCMIRYMYRG